MAEPLLDAALTRLDRAVTRLEQARPSAAAAPPAAPHIAEAYAELEERHDLLRLRIQETIDRLDVLIAGGGDAAEQH